MGSLNNTQSSSVGVVAGGWSDLPKAEVLAELDRILESHHFHTSKKCSRFLRHIVEAALDGRFDCLKERTLGVDVFDREPHYDTNQDPIVRGTAGEVRKRLAQYYLEARDGELRFSLPPGSYIPEAHYVAPEHAKRIQANTLAADIGPQPVKQRNWLALALGVLALFTAVAVSCWLLLRPNSLDRFWAPVMTGNNSVLVCMGQPRFYIFSPNTARVLNPWFASEQDHRGLPPVTSVPLSEVVPMWDRSVSLADAQAFSRLENHFARNRKQLDLRGERSISLADLRGRPSIFIGAFNNDWTLSFAGELRFYFDTDHERHAQIIRDRQEPAATDWNLVDAWPPGRDINKDYALVTRVVNRTTEGTIVILGGISQYGTEAAAEFVTNPTYFDRALKQAPSDWYRKNIQIVLSTKVLSGVSGPPTVVAAYFW